MSSEILRTVDLLAGGVVEVRALADGATHSGYFDDYDALARAAEALDADPSVTGIYVTLNAVNPALLARRANRIKLRLSRKDATTADADITRRRWLPVDIDPVRPSGVSSTDAEHNAAIAAANRIAAYLAEQGFAGALQIRGCPNLTACFSTWFPLFLHQVDLSSFFFFSRSYLSL